MSTAEIDSDQSVQLHDPFLICLEDVCGKLALLGNPDSDLDGKHFGRWPYVCSTHGIQAYFLSSETTCVRIPQLSAGEALHRGERTPDEHSRLLSKWVAYQSYGHCPVGHFNARRPVSLELDGVFRIALSCNLHPICAYNFPLSLGLVDTAHLPLVERLRVGTRDPEQHAYVLSDVSYATGRCLERDCLRTLGSYRGLMGKPLRMRMECVEHGLQAYAYINNDEDAFILRYIQHLSSTEARRQGERTEAEHDCVIMRWIAVNGSDADFCVDLDAILWRASARADLWDRDSAEHAPGAAPEEDEDESSIIATQATDGSDDEHSLPDAEEMEGTPMAAHAIFGDGHTRSRSASPIRDYRISTSTMSNRPAIGLERAAAVIMVLLQERTGSTASYEYPTVFIQQPLNDALMNTHSSNLIRALSLPAPGILRTERIQRALRCQPTSKRSQLCAESGCIRSAQRKCGWSMCFLHCVRTGGLGVACDDAKHERLGQNANFTHSVRVYFVNTGSTIKMLVKVTDNRFCLQIYLKDRVFRDIHGGFVYQYMPFDIDRPCNLPNGEWIKRNISDYGSIPIIRGLDTTLLVSSVAQLRLVISTGLDVGEIDRAGELIHRFVERGNRARLARLQVDPAAAAFRSEMVGLGKQI